jgi:hypothetical protein
MDQNESLKENFTERKTQYFTICELHEKSWRQSNYPLAVELMNQPCHIQ